MARPEAVIFDLGGTLATPEDWTGAVARALRRMGLDDAGADRWCEEATAGVGHPEGPKTSRRRLRRHRDAWAEAVLVAAGVEDGLPARTALLRRVVETEILWRPPYPDVPEMLDRIVAEGYRIGVASNNDGRTREKVAAIGLAHPFEVIVDSLEERTAKPEPDLVLVAAERMGVMPFRALYVGNDPEKDVVSAHAAGMPVAWVEREGAGPGRYHAEIVLPDLSGLPEAIRETFG
jgi:HAD superfamily hydrolase (TIGR01509 family)